MDDVFRKMEQAGKNDVDNLAKWMKDSKLVTATKEGEAKAKSLLNSVADRNKVSLEKFKEVLHEVADEQNKNVEQLKNMLVAESQHMLTALGAGIDAFVKEMGKKKT